VIGRKIGGSVWGGGEEENIWRRERKKEIPCTVSFS
jgi:hypothetical protein